jgi:DNA-binding HxlR family transcriptional regulator
LLNGCCLLLVDSIESDYYEQQEYELTALSRSLLRPMQCQADWVIENWRQVKAARIEFDAR